MITKTSHERIAQLGQTITDASEELAQLFHDLAVEADAQMAAAAQAFLKEHGDKTKGPLWASYAKAHETLLSAAVAASNIRDLDQRANSLRHKCTWWASLNGRGQQASDSRKVCENVSDAIEAPASEQA